MKKLLSISLATVLCFGLSIPASAAAEDSLPAVNETETENNILPDTVTLSGDNDSSFHCAGSVITIEKNAQTITYLSYFSADAKELPETVSLTVGQFKGIPSISEETQTCTWQPTNQGSILSGEITDESAATIGTVLLSPFSLKFDLNSSKQESYDNLLLSIV